MVRGGRVTAIIGLGLLGACTRPVDDPLAARSIYWGLAPMPTYQGELPEVLFSAADTPANQGLLYTAMVEAEVAAQYAGRAVAAETPSLARSALGEVLYAIDPEATPTWDAQSTGIVAGRGYGVRRAASTMAAAIRAAQGEAGASAALAEYGPRAASCADNTLARADRIVELGRQALDEAPAAELMQLLRQIDGLARELQQGGGVEDRDGTCGLQQAERYLERLAPLPS